MEKLTLITLLEQQIKQEINRLEQSKLINEKKEASRLTIYQNLVHHV